MSDPQPILMPKDRDEIRVNCHYCSREVIWPQGDPPLDEIIGFTVRLPLDKDAAKVACDRGHEHYVVREGSQEAATFGAG